MSRRSRQRASVLPRTPRLPQADAKYPKPGWRSVLATRAASIRHFSRRFRSAMIGRLQFRQPGLQTPKHAFGNRHRLLPGQQILDQSSLKVDIALERCNPIVAIGRIFHVVYHVVIGLFFHSSFPIDPKSLLLLHFAPVRRQCRIAGLAPADTTSCRCSLLERRDASSAQSVKGLIRVVGFPIRPVFRPAPAAVIALAPLLRR